MIVLDHTLRFHPDDDKSNVKVPFTLIKDAKALRITCSYSPKKIEDEALAQQAVLCSIGRYVPRYQLTLYQDTIKKGIELVNLLTLSLDAGETYLGCAHRHAPKQEHLVSESFSSPGFCRFAPKAGQYQAVINIHSITSKEVVYNLKVEALFEEVDA